MSDPVIIFTDGACSGNPGPGGWGAVLVSPLGKVRELGGASPKTTNNKMELTAALEALLSLAKVKSLSTNKIRLYTDSKYVIQGITEWIHGWRRRGWKNQQGADVANRELWEQLEQAVKDGGFEVEWLYVPGHAGIAGNERCDEIAVGFAKGNPPRLYAGPREEYPLDLDDVPAPGAPAAKKKVLYLSWVDGELFRDATWAACEARVRGRPGAKFKKVSSQAEETAVLKAWGVKS